MVTVKVEGVTKRYGEVEALRDVSLEVDSGKLVCILGPSGSGKTTLLRIIAGLIMPDEGRVLFDDEDITYLPPYKRNVGFVFQRIALFPHMSVFDNVAFGLKIRRLPKSEVKRRVREALELVGLKGYEGRRATQLSGGEAQRVAIARALVIDPKVLLMDEPLSNVDAKLRDRLKYEIRRLQKITGKTAIYVTHDQNVAFAIADYIYVVDKGRIVQSGTPIELYLKPASPFIADFIGTTNFVRGRVNRRGEEAFDVVVSAGGLEIMAQGVEDVELGTDVVVSVRPEDITMVEGDKVNELRGKYLNVVRGKVVRKTFIGPYLRAEVDVGLEEPLKVDVYGEERFKYLNLKEGCEVTLGFNRATVIRGSV